MNQRAWRVIVVCVGLALHACSKHGHNRDADADAAPNSSSATRAGSSAAAAGSTGAHAGSGSADAGHAGDQTSSAKPDGGTVPPPPPSPCTLGCVGLSSVTIDVFAAPDAGVLAIGELTVSGDGGVLSCRRVACARFQCDAQVAALGPVTLVADGFEPATVMTGPAPDRGPCSCGISTHLQVELVPVGDGPELSCDLATGAVVPLASCGGDDDANNCGSCGHVCRKPDVGTAQCSMGQCMPALSGCVALTTTTSCDELCATLGEQCVSQGCDGSTLALYPGQDLCTTVTSGITQPIDCAAKTGPSALPARCCCRS